MPYKDPAVDRAKRRERHVRQKLADPEKQRSVNRQRRRNWRAANPQAAAYLTQKSHAKSRGIPFLLTFDEWWDIWKTSGKWEHRGKCRGQYVMARNGDTGPYAKDNVRICTGTENISEIIVTEEMRQQMSESRRGRQHSAQGRQNMSAAQKKSWLSRSRSPSDEARRKMSEAQKARQARIRNASGNHGTSLL